MSVNGPISPNQCYHEIDYSFYSFYWLDSLEIRLDHNSTYYRSLSKNSDVNRRISHCDSQNLQYKTHPEFWPSHRRIFKTSLYYKTRLILETRRYLVKPPSVHNDSFCCYQALTMILSVATRHWQWFFLLPPGISNDSFCHHQVLFLHGLGEPQLLELANCPQKLVVKLYEHPSISQPVVGRKMPGGNGADGLTWNF